MPVYQRSQFTDLFLYTAVLLNVAPEFYRVISNALQCLTIPAFRFHEIPEYEELVNPHSDVSQQKRDIVLKLALKAEVSSVLFLMLEKDPYFELEHEDLKKIVKLECEELIDRFVENRFILMRRRARVNYTRNIIERLTEVKASKSKVRYIDFISAKIDQGMPTDIIMETAEKIIEPEEKEAVLCLFIARKAYKLFKDYY